MNYKNETFLKFCMLLVKNIYMTYFNEKKWKATLKRLSSEIKRFRHVFIYNNLPRKDFPWHQLSAILRAFGLPWHLMQAAVSPGPQRPIAYNAYNKLPETANLP